jgi:hypothetical protein
MTDTITATVRSADEYRTQAADCREQSKRASNPHHKQNWLKIAVQWQNLAEMVGNAPSCRRVVVMAGEQQHHEHALEWIAAGLVALFIFAGVAFYSFGVDVRSVGGLPMKGASNHRL